MDYSLINLMTLAVGIVFLINGYRLIQQGREDIALFLMSSVVGVGLAVVAVVPEIFQRVATIIGLELKARAILVTSNLVLFVITTYLFDRLGRLSKSISELNEELTLLRAEQEYSEEER